MGKSAAGNPQIVDLEAWRARAAKGGDAPAEGVLRKQYAARVKAMDDDSRKVAITIATKALDRHNDTVDPLGIETENFQKNPVVLWAHAHHLPPIARSVSLKANSRALRSVAEFMPEELSPFAETVFQMLKGGWLNAASIGFLAKKGGYEYDPDRGGFDFRKTELIEYSIVPIPANPQALVGAKAAGVPMAPLKAWAEEVLDSLAGPGQWMPKGQAEAALKALASAQVVVPAPPAPPAPAPEPPPAVLLAAEPTYLVNTDDVQAAVVAAVTEEIVAQLNAARGRLD